MEIDCISDLHGDYPELPGGDLLIIAGDITARDTGVEWVKFYDWLLVQPYKQKIYTAGNHDVKKTKVPSNKQILAMYGEIRNPHIQYLCDEGFEFEGLKIWGAPWTWRFHGINPHCAAFTFVERNKLRDKWALIPEDTDILVTHGPPYGVLDQSMYRERFGCSHLIDRVRQLPNLKLHVFGHIHEGYGQTREYSGRWNSEPETLKHLSVNAAHMDWEYKPVNPPIRVVL